MIGQVVLFLLLGEAAELTTSADMALMMAARFLREGDRWSVRGAFGLGVGLAGVAAVLWSP